MTAARKMMTPTAVPDPESRPRPRRRTFTKEYKLKILEEADQAKPGEIGALLRREGLYSGSLSEWRKERQLGTLGALASKKRGPKTKHDPQRAETERLRRQLARAEKRLEVAEKIIATQKKLCMLLGLPAETEPEDESSP
jgi:transposase-like protein